MSVREIPRSDWSRFLDDFSREHRAWLASVTHLGSETERHAQVVERPLESVTSERDGIYVRFLEDPSADDAVRIDAPRRIRVEQAADGAALRVEIEGNHGDWIQIALRVPSPPGLLDGVAPGEL